MILTEAGKIFNLQNPNQLQLKMPDPTSPILTPLSPPLTVISISRSVGRGGANRATDVSSLQHRLRALNYLSANHLTRETPSLADPEAIVPEAGLAATIATIENFQREVVGHTQPDGQVGPNGPTLQHLNRALPRPTPAQLAAIQAALDSIGHVRIQGVAIDKPVGNVPLADLAAGQGNLTADIRAVQTRLVSLGYLSITHSEIPPTGLNAPVPPHRLTATRKAIARFQQKELRDVTGTGTIFPEDAAHQRLTAIVSHQLNFPGEESIRFRDHVRSSFTIANQGVSVVGTARPSSLPEAEYAAVGLSPNQTAALQHVSQHEGNFDALNTYDRARVSFGFIQFAGGRGLPLLLALLKAREPAIFKTLFQTYGIDVEFSVANGRLQSAQLAVVDPATGSVLRGDAAEEAIRDSPRRSAVFIRAGRNPIVQRIQVEAAARDFILPSLAVSLRLTEEPAETPALLEEVLTSRQSLAVLMDRAIQEGAGPGGAGVRRLLAAAKEVAERQGITRATEMKNHQELILRQIVQDMTADIDICVHLKETAAQLDQLLGLAVPAGAELTGLLTTSQLLEARSRLEAAAALCLNKSPGSARAGLSSALPAERLRLDFSPLPAGLEEARGILRNVRDNLDGMLKSLNPGNATIFRERVEKILESELSVDS